MKTLLNKFKALSAEIKMGIFLLLISFLIIVLFDRNLFEILAKNKDVIIKISYLTVMAVGISTIIHFLIPANFVEKHLQQNSFKYLVYATIFGILTPGPVYAIYPIVMVLKKKGIQNPILVSYLTGQTIVGPARIPFEVGLFGLDFFLYRIALSLIMGPAAGLLYILFSRILPDREPAKDRRL